MNNMLAMITAKEKAMIVIESCVTHKQLSLALNYIYNYYQLFKDIEGHLDLMEIFVNKRLELHRINCIKNDTNTNTKKRNYRR